MKVQFLDQPRGKLFYLMGASGAGKNRLLQTFRNCLPEDMQVIVAHRYTTDQHYSRQDNYVILSEREFAYRWQRGMLSMNWHRYDAYYGIGTELEQWLEKDEIVIVNGSRNYLPIAWKRYPQLIPVLINVDEQVLAARLQEHENAENDPSFIKTRLQEAKRQQQELQRFPEALKARIRYVDNNGLISEACEELCHVIQSEIALDLDIAV